MDEEAGRIRWGGPGAVAGGESAVEIESEGAEELEERRVDPVRRQMAGWAGARGVVWGDWREG